MADDKSNKAISTTPQAATSAPGTMVRFREWWALDEAKNRSKRKVDPVRQALDQMDLLTRKIDRSPGSRSRDRNLAQQNRILAMLAVRLARKPQKTGLKRAR